MRLALPGELAKHAMSEGKVINHQVHLVLANRATRSFALSNFSLVFYM